jgi:hypothetical protein
MASSSKRQRTTRQRGSSSSQAPEVPPQPQPQVQPEPQPQPPHPINQHLSYLNHPNLSSYFDKLNTYEIQQDRYVNFVDLQHYDIDTIFQASRLYNLLDADNMDPCFPYLVKLFYTNMTSNEPNQTTAIMSNVLNNPIRVTIPLLGHILGIPFTGTLLKNVKMEDLNVLARMMNPNVRPDPPFNSNNLLPQARIVSRILSWSIIPKGGSYTYVSQNLLKATYSIMAELNINWARVIFDNIRKPTSRILHHGCFLTTIFKHFNVNVYMEGLEVQPHLPYFDRAALTRMALPYDPDDSDIEPQEEQGEEEEEEEEEVQAQQAPPPHHPGYDDIINRVNNLSMTQDRLVASHYVMQHQLSNIRDDQREMLEYQREMMRRFNEHFPPPQ